MKRTESKLMALVELDLDGTALCEAALLHDWDEVRFRCHLVVASADQANLIAVSLAAAKLSGLLGAVGSTPRPGYGAVMKQLAEKLRNAA